MVLGQFVLSFRYNNCSLDCVYQKVCVYMVVMLVMPMPMMTYLMINDAYFEWYKENTGKPLN